MPNIEFKELSKHSIKEISNITKELNPKTDISVLVARQTEMFDIQNYHCFGIFLEKKLIGVCSGWLLTKLYSGKQLELDNFVVLPQHQSQGIGKYFLEFIEEWAKNKGCLAVELNAYIKNNLAHKFYFNQGFSIVGFHFMKSI